MAILTPLFRVTTWARAAMLAMTAVAAGCGNDSTATVKTPDQRPGSITMIAGYATPTNGETCTPGGSGTLTFSVTPGNLIGSSGLDTQQSAAVALPQTSSEVSPGIPEGTPTPTYGCQVEKTFSNLKPGQWTAKVTGATQVTGPTGATSCPAPVTGSSNKRVKIWAGTCSS